MDIDATISDGPWDVARRALPGVDLPRDRYDAVLAAHPHIDATEASAVEAADLYLVTACDDGVDGAWDALQQRHFETLRHRLRARGASADQARAVLDELPGHLCEPPPSGGAKTRLGTWDGRGLLVAWLTVVALRRWWQTLRDRGATLPHVTTPVDPHATPLGRSMGADLAGRFERALHDAWGRLTPRECLAVLLRFRDGLPQTRIAAAMGVGEPRVSRLVASGVGKLREGVGRSLGDGADGGGRRQDALWAALRDAASESLATSPSSSNDSSGGQGDDGDRTTPA